MKTVTTIIGAMGFLLLCAALENASAQTVRDWINAGGGTFSDSANWQGGNVPGVINDTARFATNGTFTVTLTADVITRKADFSAPNAVVSFDLGGYLMNITNWWDQGPTSGRTNIVRLISAGALRTGSDMTVAKAGARSSLHLLHAGVTVTNQGTTRISDGAGSHGELIVSNGQVIAGGVFTVGRPAASTGLVRIVEGSIKSTSTANPSFIVGESGNAAVSLESATAMLVTTGGTVHLARYGTSSGSVVLAEGTWDASQNILVGNAGLASLTIHSGMLTNRNGELWVSYTGGMGRVILTGSDARLYVKTIALGGDAGAGDAVMVVSNGYVQAESFNLGWRNNGSAGHLTWLAGTGVFSQASSKVADGAAGTSTLTVSGGRLDFGSQNLVVGSLGNGAMTFSNGAIITSGELRLAVGAASIANLAMSGGTATVANLNFFAHPTTPNGASATFAQSGGVLELGNIQAYKPANSVTNVLLSGGTWVTTNTIDTASQPINLTLTDSPGPGDFTLDTREFNFTQHGSISGNGSLVKRGSGRMSLRANAMHTGTTTVENGVLSLDFSGAISGSSLITVLGGTSIEVTNQTQRTLALAAGQTLAGLGQIIGNVSLAGGTVSPGGNTVGSLAMTSFSPGSGRIEIDITDANGSAGVDWDVIHVGAGAGPVTNLASSADPIIIDFRCALPTLPNFDGLNPTSWVVVRAGSHANFAANTFAISTDAFTPAAKNNGSFTASLTGGDLYIHYQPAVPGDLGLSIQVSTNFALPGQPVEFTIVITNHSAATSGSYYLTNQLGSDFVFVTGSVGAVASGSTVTWSLGGLAGGASTSIVLTVTPVYTGSTQELNSAVSATVFHVPGDPVPGNNSATSGSVTTVGIPMMTFWVLLAFGAALAFGLYRRSRTPAHVTQT